MQLRYFQSCFCRTFSKHIGAALAWRLCILQSADACKAVNA